MPLFLSRLRGSYDELHWGKISEALVDFTGGVQKTFDLRNPPDNLYEIMKAAANSNCLMGCITPGGVSQKLCVCVCASVRMHLCVRACVLFPFDIALTRMFIVRHTQCFKCSILGGGGKEALTSYVPGSSATRGQEHKCRPHLTQK